MKTDLGDTTAREIDQPAVGEPDGEDMDLAEMLADIWSESSDDASGQLTPTAGDDDIDDPVQQALSGSRVNPLVVAELVGRLPEAADAAGASAAASSEAPADEPLLGHSPPDVEPGAPADEPWSKLIGPSASGYVNDDRRSVMRIQRGKPLGRCTITCYKHRGCNLLLNLNRCPDDKELFQWLYEVEPVTRETPPAAAKELASRHMALGKQRWSAPLRPE